MFSFHLRHRSEQCIQFLLIHALFVYLQDVNNHASCRAELFMTDMALEMLRFLVLDKHFVVLELAIAVIAPRLYRLLLLFPHFSGPDDRRKSLSQPVSVSAKGALLRRYRPD